MTVRLWRDEPDGESDESILREQLDAMSAFAQGWLEPLAVAIDVTCLEHGQHSDPRSDVPSWLIRTSGLPALRMEPVVAGSRVEDRKRCANRTWRRGRRRDWRLARQGAGAVNPSDTRAGGGGTWKPDSGPASSSAFKRERVDDQCFGASSRYRSSGQ